MQLPHPILAADWSKNAAKRRMARAERTPAGRFLVRPTEPVGDVTEMAQEARSFMGGRNAPDAG